MRSTLAPAPFVWRSDPRFEPLDDEDDEPAITTAPVVVGDRLFVADSQGIAVRDRQTGALQQEFDADPGPALHGDPLVVCGLNDVWAVDAVTLRERWRNKDLSGGVQVTPAFHDGVGVAALGFEASHTHGGVVVFDVDTGAKLRELGDTYRSLKG
ncbi:hypothetical protein [Nonomuraea roseola]|uniref:Uncharacterized protein n=1 Tax=Nonomuraea roseola TaxID=46179 RepID=A0ABV5PS14_9ACTN